MTEMYFSLLAINKDCVSASCVCDELLPFFCQSYTSNTLPVSTFCAWCEICKCAPFAETVPDWQWDTFVVSRWGWHISPLLSIFLTLCHCLLQDVKLVLGGPRADRWVSWWSLQSGQRVRGTTSWSPRLPLKIQLMLYVASWVHAENKHQWLLSDWVLNSCDTLGEACGDFFLKNTIWLISVMVNSSSTK